MTSKGRLFAKALIESPTMTNILSSVTVGSGTEIFSTIKVATSNDLPVSANVGDQAYVIDTNSLLAWNGSSWAAISGGSSVTVSDTAPADPSEGDTWFNSELLETYVYYGTTWVLSNAPVYTTSPSSSSSGGVTSYDSSGLFPSSNSAGDLAFDKSTKALYIWDSSEWDRVHTGANESPVWTTTLNSQYILGLDDSATITTSAYDPEGFPITYSYDTYPLNTPLFTVSESAGTFSITTTADSQYAGQSALLRTKATDGVQVAARSASIVIGASSASQLYAGGITTDGVYDLYLNGFSSPAVSCYCNFTLPGGPYILVMVVASGTAGNTYGYDGTVWTDTSGGVTTPLDPTSDTNQVSSLFYTLPTTGTALALGTNASTHMQYYTHASYTARALANGALSVPTSISWDTTYANYGTEVVDGQASAPSGWIQHHTDAGYTWNAGSTYYRYGWQHGTPVPAEFGYIRFGHSADTDTSDSRDRYIGIGLKNNSGGPLASNVIGAGSGNYTTTNIARVQGWLYIKN